MTDPYGLYKLFDTESNFAKQHLGKVYVSLFCIIHHDDFVPAGINKRSLQSEGQVIKHIDIWSQGLRGKQIHQWLINHFKSGLMIEDSYIESNTRSYTTRYTIYGELTEPKHLFDEKWHEQLIIYKLES
jgi:hypothetical protein